MTDKEKTDSEYLMNERKPNQKYFSFDSDNFETWTINDKYKSDVKYEQSE